LLLICGGALLLICTDSLWPRRGGRLSAWPMHATVFRGPCATTVHVRTPSPRPHAVGTYKMGGGGQSVAFRRCAWANHRVCAILPKRSCALPRPPAPRVRLPPLCTWRLMARVARGGLRRGAQLSHVCQHGLAITDYVKHKMATNPNGHNSRSSAWNRTIRLALES
jgi:hypothetical protein